MSQESLTTLYFASSSRNKYEDYQFLLGKYADLRWSRVIIEEPQTMNLEILIRRKIERVKQLLPYLPFIVEQTGLVIKGWGNLPGNLTGMFMHAVGNEGICRMMTAYSGKEERAATAITDLGYHAPDDRVIVFRGSLDGYIATKPRGERGFGWDAIFIPEGQDETLAEMSADRKNNLSTRTAAVTQFYASVLDSTQASEVAQNRIQFRQLLIRHFNKTELVDLCFLLDIDPEDVLPDTVKREQIRELILYCDRHSRIPDLLEACRSERPNVTWPDFV